MPSGTRSHLPPAPRPHADGSGINSDQPEGEILTLGSAWPSTCVLKECRETWREPAEGVCRPCLLLHAAAITRRLLVYLVLGVGCAAGGETQSDLFRRLHAGVMRLIMMMATSRPLSGINI
jgi:hypothetical protein